MSRTPRGVSGSGLWGLVLVGLLAAGGAGLPGCAHGPRSVAVRTVEVNGASGGGEKHGPPPHAPAHGYRSKHPQDPGVEVAFDPEIGVHVVLGREAVYWDGERYIRWSDGGWEASARIDGVWVGVSSDAVPARLVARYAGGESKAKKRRGPPARHAH